MPWGIKKAFVALFSNASCIKSDDTDEDDVEFPTFSSSCSIASNLTPPPLQYTKSRSISRSSKKSKRSKSKPQNYIIPGVEIDNIDKVFKELECPVCFNTCAPPIFPCINGHIVCNKCRESMERCPTCREGFSNTRNLFAEQFIMESSRACKFAYGGCQYLKWKTEDIGPHEAKCYYRNIQCPVPSCKRSIEFTEVLNHLLDAHKVYGTDQLPVMIKYDTEEPLIANRRWLPYYIKAYGCVFYVMMEIARPHFRAWIYVHISNEEQNDDTSKFHSTITFMHQQKALFAEWKGPVHSIRTPGSKIIKDALCFGASETFVQNFEENGIISVIVNIKNSEKSSLPQPVFPFLQGTSRSRMSVISIPASGIEMREGHHSSSSSIELIHRRNQNRRRRSRSRSCNSASSGGSYESKPDSALEIPVDVIYEDDEEEDLLK